MVSARNVNGHGVSIERWLLILVRDRLDQVYRELAYVRLDDRAAKRLDDRLVTKANAQYRYVLDNRRQFEGCFLRRLDDKDRVI